MSLVIPGYAVGAVLAEGGFGLLLEARAQDGRAAIVKLARPGLPAARAQLAREAEALRDLGAPAAPALLAEGIAADGAPYLVLERIPGTPLEASLRSGALGGGAVRVVSLAVAAALARVHARGWAHGDVKPSHLFLDEATARLVDFGLAARAGAATRGEGTAFAGTPIYMAPEQCRGAPPVPASDVYAAGAVLFELLTGAPPFRGTPAELHQAHLASRPPRPSAVAPVPAELEAVVLRCLAKDPAERYPDAAALRDALAEAFLASSAAGAVPAAAAHPAPARPRSARRQVALVRFRTAADLLAVARAVEGAGGRLALSAADRHVAVFEPGARDNAVRRALDGARALAAAGVAERAVVDLDTLAVVEAGPVRRYVGKLDRPEAFPDGAGPAAVALTPAAAAVVPDLLLVRTGSGDLRRIAAPEDAPTGATLPPLVGREGPLRALEDEIAAALRERAPAFATVIADAGHGKSRLAAELSAALARLPARPEVALVRGDEGGAPGDATLRALLAWALPGAAGAVPDDPRARLAAALPAESGPGAWAPVALALGWISPAHPALAPWSAAPGALRAAAVRAAGRAIRERAAARPVCLLVDDAHLADAAALDALEYAALAEARLPLAIVAFGRPPLATARPALGERSARAARVTLGPLDDSAAAELAARLLAPAENVPASALARLVERTGGVPVLLVELVRGLRASGLVRRSEDGSAYVATDELERVPDLPLVEWLADRELAALPAGLAAHARLVALLGDGVRTEDVAGVAAALDDATQAAVPLDPRWATLRLVEERVLHAHDGRVSFRHPVLRDAIARGAPPEVRRAVHAAAARFYAAAPGLPELERLARQARHAQESAAGAEAAALWLRLAEGLAARHGYLEAETAFSRALALHGPDAATARLAALRGRGSMRYRLGRSDDAIADLAAARALAAALGDADAELDALLDEATALDWMNDWSASAARVAQAERLAAGSASALLAARLALARGRTLVRAGRFADAALAVDDAAARAAPLGDEGYETHVIALLLAGFVLPGLGRADDAASALSRAQALASARGDLLHVAAALNNRRNLRIARGELERAVEDQEAFLRIGRDLGMIGIEYAGHFNLAELRSQLGEAAEENLARAAEIERRHPGMAPKPLAPLLAARRLAHGGDLAGARARLDELRAREAAGGDTARLGPSDRLLAEAVELAVTLAPAGAWLALRGRTERDSVEQEPIEIAELHALTALRAGRREEAAAAMGDALGLAGRIPNAMARRLAATAARVEAG